jgi:hypothetical protein
MIREAQRSGLNFDPDTLENMGLAAAMTTGATRDGGNEEIKINVSMPSPDLGVHSTDWGARLNGGGDDHANREKGIEEHHDVEDCDDDNPFHQMLHKAHTARIHDSLTFASGLGRMQVMSWNFMEYLPFRRMDLQADGSWKPIRWPLPCGEVRDIPDNARVHGSVIRRMKMDEKYRPGNLIVGGGGRGLRKAPGHYGMGDWECVAEHGDPIGEIW